MKTLFCFFLLLGLTPQVSTAQSIVSDFLPVSDREGNFTESIDGEREIRRHFCNQIHNHKFTYIGKGGLPVNPNNLLTTAYIEVGLIAVLTSTEERNSISDNQFRDYLPQEQKAPAMGWRQKDDNTFEFVALSHDIKKQQRFWNYLERSCSA